MTVSKRISFRLSDAELVRLRHSAEQSSMSVSEYLRAGIDGKRIADERSDDSLNRQINLRLSETEYSRLKKYSSASGLSISDYLRSGIGDKRTYPEIPEEIKKYRRAVNSINNNLKQIYYLGQAKNLNVDRISELSKKYSLTSHHLLDLMGQITDRLIAPPTFGPDFESDLNILNASGHELNKLIILARTKEFRIDEINDLALKLDQLLGDMSKKYFYRLMQKCVTRDTPW